jgi:YbgC/YbaW family acyl-CoA thioester hydrolase
MPRLKITLPDKFTFTCDIPVRITDINYGNHVGNDSILSILHEARMQFLNSLGYTELAFEGIGLIMADVSIEFKKEIFYGDTIKVSLEITEISGIGFEIFYKLETIHEITTVNSLVPSVIAKTNMVCYDYDRKKVVTLPAQAKEKLMHQ